MHPSHLHYLPLPLPFFSILIGIFLAIDLLLQIGALEYAYTRLGFCAGAALLLLMRSLIGGYVNVPIADLPERHVVSGHEVALFGMRYAILILVEWPRIIIAINVGGALIPAAL